MRSCPIEYVHRRRILQLLMGLAFFPYFKNAIQNHAGNSETSLI